MPEANLLKGELREKVGKSSTKLSRKEGKVPCIVYGDKIDPISININSISAWKLYNTGRMLTTLLDLELSNGDKMKVIPKEIKIDTVKDNIIHIDMLRLAEDARVSVEIQVNFVGEDDSPGIKSGGVLTVTRYTVELDCPALKIPESLDVDISTLDMGESVKLSDVNLPDDVNPVITDRDITIASVTAPVEEIEEEIIEEEAEEGEEGEEGAEGGEGAEGDGEKTEEDSQDTKEENKE